MNYTLITGASSGIGYELAKIFAKNGDFLILVSRNQNKLQQITNEFKNIYNIEVRIIPQDLSSTNASDNIYNQIKKWSISINNIVNNAGFYIKGSFSDTFWEKEHDLIQLECINHIKLIKLFLPEMLKNHEGGILNVCSTGSFMPGPYNAIYCASKSFMLSFTEAIAEELINTRIRVTALCPGGTNTTFQDLNNRINTIFNPLLDPSLVAKIGYNAFMKGKRVVVPGMTNKMQVFALRLLPRKIITKLAGMYVKN